MDVFRRFLEHHVPELFRPRRVVLRKKYPKEKGHTPSLYYSIPVLGHAKDLFAVS